MEKVFIIHGFEGTPNGCWRPWLMAELEKQDVYACSLAMPTPNEPICNEWVQEIARHVELNKNEQIYLVGHSLGVPAILRYLESTEAKNIHGVVLVSGPSENNGYEKLDSFFDKTFNFENAKMKCKNFAIIHGDNDTLVPLSNAQLLAKELNGELILVKNGGHLNGSSGWTALPECLTALNKMMQ